MVCIIRSFLLLRGYTMICLCIYQLKDIWRTFPVWDLLWIKLLWAIMQKSLCGHKFSILLGKFVEVKLLRHIVRICIRNCQNVFQSSFQLYIPSGKTRDFQLFHMLAIVNLLNFTYPREILLTYIFLMTNNIDNLSCLLAICKSFINNLFNVLHILKLDCLPYYWVKVIFSWYKPSYILLIVLLKI